MIVNKHLNSTRTMHGLIYGYTYVWMNLRLGPNSTCLAKEMPCTSNDRNDHKFHLVRWRKVSWFIGVPPSLRSQSIRGKKEKWRHEKKPCKFNLELKTENVFPIWNWNMLYQQKNLIYVFYKKFNINKNKLRTCNVY